MDRPLSECLTHAKTGLVNSTYRDDYIEQEKSFANEDFITISAAGTIYFALELSSCTCDKVYMLPITVNPTAGTATVTVYEGSDYTGVNALLLRNRILTSSNTIAKATLKDTATGTTKGTKFKGLVFGTDSTRQSSGGGRNTGAARWGLDKTKIYLFEVTNSDACIMGYNMELIEA